jgi:hypothetical protein
VCDYETSNPVVQSKAHDQASQACQRDGGVWFSAPAVCDYETSAPVPTRR